jgi:penicillin-binding protein A
MTDPMDDRKPTRDRGAVGPPPAVARNIFRTGIALVLAFAILAGGAGWWQVIEAERLSTAADNPAVVAVARRALRGDIVDRDGRWLARSERDANGEAIRRYRDRTISHVVGYASRRFGTAGLERSYNAELVGLVGRTPLDTMLGKFDPRPSEPLGLRTTLDLRLQRLAIEGLGSDRGAVVILDPTTGEVLALASTPTYNAGAIADPATAADAFEGLRTNPSEPLLPRATLGRYVPGSVFKIVTAMAALDSGSVSPDTTFPEQPGAEERGLLVGGFRIRDNHHPFTGDEELDLARATEVSCNIWYALAGLEAGGDNLVRTASRLGFGERIPFELPTAISRVTGGGGDAPGGFADIVELAAASMGQGETFVTPLQMALVASAVANDGMLMRPQLVTELRQGDETVRTIGASRWQRVVSVADARAIQQAMQLAVEGQDGRRFTTGSKVRGVPTAGKSGTAQLGGEGEPHSWFIGFAPVDEPRIAIAVVVEQGGRGATRAAPLAGSLMSAYFDLYGRP